MIQQVYCFWSMFGKHVLFITGINRIAIMKNIVLGDD